MDGSFASPLRKVYQVWLDRRTGLYYGVRLEAGKIVAMTAGYPQPPRAFALPTLPMGPVREPVPRASDPRWRLVRLSFH